MEATNSTTRGAFQSTSSADKFDGEDFSNNLFTDLAPLLTLFGEQVTKQFLSQSMGYADDILLAMAPLGILTCVISAIRVGGRRWLRALVGRARETRATAEMELLSCTSDAVCELWSGTEIVRERGAAQTKEFIYRKIDSNDRPKDGEAHNIIFDLKTACEHGIMIGSHPRLDDSRTRTVSREALHALMVRNAVRIMKQAPNLTLNVSDATTSPAITWAFAIFGIIVQVCVLAIAALVTYHWRVPAQGSTIVRYGFPVFALGTMVLSAGIFICSYVIEAHTEEIDFNLVEKIGNTKIIRIQRACTVGDQRYGSYAIMNEEGSRTLRTSRINEPPDFSIFSLVAASMSICGYIMQFIGLRAMHWSVAVTVLGAMLVMACTRAFVRRGLAANPKVVKLMEGHELSWVMMDACGIDSLKITPEIWLGVDGLVSQPWDPRSDLPNPALGHMRSLPTDWLIRAMVEGRKEVGKLVSWGDDCSHLAHQLATAITGVLQYISDENDAFEIRKIPLVFKQPPKKENSGHGLAEYPTANDFSAAVESRGFEVASGLLEYRLPGQDTTLGAGFQWKCGMSLMRHRSAEEERHQYQFRAQAVRPRYSDPEKSGSDVGRSASVFRWTMDVASLTAILSLLAFTSAKSLDPDEKSGKAVRLLGRGWDVPIPTRLLFTGAHEPETALSGLGQHQPAIGQELETCSGHDGRAEQYQLTDFYGIWIRRPSPAVFEWSQVPPSINRDFIFGGSLDGVSRNVRREAILQAENSTRKHLATHDNLKANGFREIIKPLSRILSHVAPDGRRLHADQFERAKGIYVSHSPARLYAQEIFTEFMLQLASRTTEIRGHTRRRPPLPGDRPDEPRWGHSVISRLADIVRDSGLAADEEEAYILVVPPLHAYGLLPTNPKLADDGSDLSAPGDAIGVPLPQGRGRERE
ncbi:uncharacterized protein DSM5745_06523 [Aspergillus mulundensis]|uniref:Uncharacterized protein n=1 Tax=Aspergillus mulundensis TaxID=1810919 RepID=A0A3D8RRV2_9EURO|nr:hypothetical protein DSM5745_06523 [Aspergillus mulundensis]RDW76531.1 hypothetical protein DSM5745_06523 [Aspergillus mulundensis]